MVPPHVDSSAFEATLIGPTPEQDASPARSAWEARVELVSGSGPGMDTETQALLRIRLRAASIVLLAAVGAFFIRSFLVEDAPARIPQAGVFCVLAAVVGILSSRRPLSLSQLRQYEVGIFALLIIYLGYYEFRLVLTKARAGNPIFELAAFKSCILLFFRRHSPVWNLHSQYLAAGGATHRAPGARAVCRHGPVAVGFDDR